MSGKDLTYFKFVCDLIDAGIWAKMSSSAKTLYPVLLRFSDRNFSPVYPGSKTLLELTGFKQKSSLRKARKELVDLGLISITTGTGRKNTIYHFRFDWIPLRGTYKPPPEDISNTPLENESTPPTQTFLSSTRSHSWQPPYNQIQISINNNQGTESTRKKETELHKKSHTNFKKDEFMELRKQYGSKNVDLAISEARLADLPINFSNIEKILRSNGFSVNDSKKIFETLKQKVSENTYKIIRQSFLREENGFLVFSDSLPLYMKNILYKLCDNILFEPIQTSTNFASRDHWR